MYVLLHIERQVQVAPIWKKKINKLLSDSAFSPTSEPSVGVTTVMLILIFVTILILPLKADVGV